MGQEYYMNRAYLITGGNMGNRLETLRLAADWLNASCGNILQQSAIYETAAWGKEDQPAFYNQVLLLETTLAAEELMKRLLEIEQEAGRVRTEKYGPRVLDIDILFFNQSVIQTPVVIIPHPQLPNRRFVLLPLNELAPAYRHPVLHKTVAELLAECPDPLPVHPVEIT